MKKLMVALSVILVMMVIEVFPCYSQQIIGCVNNKSGALRIVNNASLCKPGESAINWNQAGPPGSPGVGNLGVYDGSGLFLGFFSDHDYVDDLKNIAYRIFNPDISAFLMVTMFESIPSLTGYKIGAHYFTSGDCSGQPYIYFYNRIPQSLLVSYYDPGIYFLYNTQILPVQGSDIKGSVRISQSFKWLICVGFP